LHYDLHNLYGIAQSDVTYSALSKILNSRPFILSRSTFSGSGQYVAHWTGDVSPNWESMRQSISDMLLMNMFGVPMVGADICGFNSDATSELCARWSALGAFYPLARNNNDKDKKDSADSTRLRSGEVLNAGRSALLARYALLPYLYTLLYKAHRFGHTVVRPMFFEFPEDVSTYHLDKQFLWGSAILFVPVLQKGQKEVQAYLPGTWYSYPNLEKKFKSLRNPLQIVQGVEYSEIPIFIREGSIIVLQTPGDNLVKSRQNGFKILIVLDENGRAEGELYWDDGETLDPEAYNHIKLYPVDYGTIKVYKQQFKYNISMPIDHITIVGVQERVYYVMINNKT
ncbi:hypothetical protein WDU94_010123, partial [Cyamophila willieti]